MTLRVGVIGAGGMGLEHATNLAGLPDVEVAIVADVVATAADAVAGAVGAASSTDPQAVARDPSLDAVVVASPDETHADLAIAAVERGAFVLCEKPLAGSLHDAHRVVDAEQQVGRPLVQVGFMRIYDPLHQQMAAAMDTIGPVLHIRCVHRNANSKWQRPLEVVMTQSLIHDVHTVRWLSGAEFRSVAVQVVGRQRPADHVLVVGELDDGTSATIEFVEMSYGYDVEVEVTGSTSMLVCGQPADLERRTGGKGQRHIGFDWFGRFRDAYRAEAVDWVAGTKAGEVRGPSATDGLRAQEVVDAALRSAVSGERVTL